MTLAVSADGGRTWPSKRNLEVGDGYCMTNNSTRSGSTANSPIPRSRRPRTAALHIAFTYFRHAIKYVRVTEPG